ncbi:MAG TPA: iron-sulfur cluster repair protein YtfE [Kofleriaceae bacterium]|nr:iron-sulfur cluster repair protein YtfE [Kofleriaceae bacterium]
MALTREQTLGQLATAVPGATRVFLRHRLDFCCGGDRSLQQACLQAGLDADEITRELEVEAGGQQAVSWPERPLAELSEYIESRYHGGLRRDVPPLIEAARRVERVHAAKPDVPKGLADLLTDFWEEMQSHMRKEETVLFPMIRRGGRGQAVYMPVRVMEMEHDAHGQNLAALRRLAHDFAAPAHACATWRALYDGLAALERELMEHIALENNVLFPRAVADSE